MATIPVRPRRATARGGGSAKAAAPIVGDERRARHDGTLDEAAERLRASARHDGESNTPGIATTLPLVELGTRLAATNLHSTDDKNLIVDATAFAARRPPTQVSSTSTCSPGLPPIRSWSGRTIPARSLWRF
jgi:hypothetical protein